MLPSLILPPSQDQSVHSPPPPPILPPSHQVTCSVGEVLMWVGKHRASHWHSQQHTVPHTVRVSFAPGSDCFTAVSIITGEELRERREFKMELLVSFFTALQRKQHIEPEGTKQLKAKQLCSQKRCKAFLKILLAFL